MVIRVAFYSNAVLIKASDDSEICHLGLCFSFRKEILAFRAPRVIFQVLLKRRFSTEGLLSHGIDLISSQIEIVIILAGKAKTLLTVAYTSRFRNAFRIKSCSYRIGFIY